MIQAICKYTSKPVVNYISEIPLHELPENLRPIFYICQVEPFNFTIAKQHGYSSKNKYYRGLLINDDNNLNWNGNSSEISSLDLFNTIHSNKLSRISSWFKNVDSDSTLSENETVNINPTGYCSKISMKSIMKSYFWIASGYGTNFMVYVVDPNMDNDVVIRNIGSVRIRKGRYDIDVCMLFNLSLPKSK